jgi:broad specificity phosphatase PhoE
MPSLPKQVLFVRHGQGVHNLEGGDKESPDPAVRQTNRQPAMHSPQREPACLLTESHSATERDLPWLVQLNATGRAQVAATRELLAEDQRFTSLELVVTSPLRRAIQTTLVLFRGDDSSSGSDGAGPGVVPICVNALVTEEYEDGCDSGLPKHVLAAAHPEIADWEGWSELPEDWCGEPHHGDGPGRDEFLSRAPLLRAWLASRPERCIAVVGHGLQQRRDVGWRGENGQARWYTLDHDDPAGHGGPGQEEAPARPESLRFTASPVEDGGGARGGEQELTPTVWRSFLQASERDAAMSAPAASSAAADIAAGGGAASTSGGRGSGLL